MPITNSILYIEREKPAAPPVTGGGQLEEGERKRSRPISPHPEGKKKKKGVTSTHFLYMLKRDQSRKKEGEKIAPRGERERPEPYLPCNARERKEPLSSHDLCLFN